MSTYKLSLKIAEVNAAAEQAFKETAFLLGREFTRVITEPRTWSGYDGMRDIVDTGQLRSSQIAVFTKPTECVFCWPVEHAVYQHEGYTLRNGKEVKGRPWTQIAIQEFDIEQAFAQRYQANLRRI